jgi:hypothetical protein
MHGRWLQRLLRVREVEVSPGGAWWLGLVVGALAFGAMLLPAGDAHAKFVLINTGEEIYDVAELPPELAEEAPPGDWKLGYMCSHVGVFWADIWTWSCELVAYEGNTYADLPPELRTELEATYPWGAAQRSVWNKYGIWAFVGLAGIGIFMSNNEDS